MKDQTTDCPCKRVKCPRHGDCNACKAHHLTEKPKLLPTCERLRAKAAEIRTNKL